MKLSAPKIITFLIAVVVALVGLIAYFAKWAPFTGFAFWVVLLAFVILAVGNLVKGI